MNNLFKIFISIVIGLSLFSISSPELIKEVNGFNNIEITFSYLNFEDNFVIRGYGEDKSLQIESQRFYNINSHTNNNGDTVVEKFPSSILIPIEDSHKVEFQFEGKDNYVLISRLAINGNEISLQNFSKYASSLQNFKIGTMQNLDGIIVWLGDDKVVFDVTKVYKPLCVTEEQLKAFNSDYEYLNIVFCVFCIFFSLLSIHLLQKLVCHISFVRCNDKSKAKNYNVVYLFFVVIFAVIFAIHTSFYIMNANLFSLVNVDDGRLSNIIVFEQNYLPLLFVIFSPMCIALFFKRRGIKLLLSLITIFFVFVLMVDNGILNVLGTRLNFSFGGDYAGDVKYILDFVLKYMLSISGCLMLVAFALVIGSTLFLCFTTTHISKKFVMFLCSVLIVISIFGLYPLEIRSGDFKFNNVFQVNNISFSAKGDYQKDYDKVYEPRDNLDFQYQIKTGLNQHKNVILVLVESLGCNFTYICGNGPSYMPNLEKIAKDNLLYDRYYSTIPSTSYSYLSIVKSVPVIQKRSSDYNATYKTKLYDENDLIKKFNSDGYFTKFISSTDHVFGMDKTLSFSKYDEIIDAQDKIFEQYKDRYVFNSVTDDEMFKTILQMVNSEDRSFLYVTKTASNHAPYNSPFGFSNMQKAFEYTDIAVNNFINSLENIGYFKNGIVVLVGDHHAWNNNDIASNNDSYSEINRVPLIIVDGKHEGRVDHTQFSHASLGVLLQAMELPTYKYSRFNINPLEKDKTKNEFIFGYDYQRSSFVTVKYMNKESSILLSGNDTKIMNEDLFTDDEKNDILGYLAWFR
jgi:lipoteichoic acid synthase